MPENSTHESITEAGSKLLGMINSLIQNNPTRLDHVEMIIAIEKDKNSNVYQARLNKNSLDEICKMMELNLAHYSRYELIPYEYINPPNSTQAICTDINLEFIDKLRNDFSDLANLELFDSNKIDNFLPKYIAFKTSLDSHEILFIEKLSKRNYLKLSKKVFSLEKSEFYLLTPELLCIEDEFTIIVIDEMIYFRKSHLLQQLCGIDERLKKEVLLLLDAIGTRLPIANFDKLREDVSKSLNMIMKLKSIERKIHDNNNYQKNILESKAVFKFLDSHPEFDIPTTGQGEQRQLEYIRSPQKRYSILKLLDDDYLSSPITSISYNVNSKQQP